MESYTKPIIKLREVTNDMPLMGSQDDIIRGKNDVSVPVSNEEITTQDGIGAKKNFNIWDDDE